MIFSDSYNLGSRVDDQREQSLNEEPPPEALQNLFKKPQRKKTLLQRLGSDWTMFRARKINQRMDITVDGDRYTLYSR